MKKAIYALVLVMTLGSVTALAKGHTKTKATRSIATASNWDNVAACDFASQSALRAAVAASKDKSVQALLSLLDQEMGPECKTAQIYQLDNHAGRTVEVIVSAGKVLTVSP